MKTEKITLISRAGNEGNSMTIEMPSFKVDGMLYENRSINWEIVEDSQNPKSAIYLTADQAEQVRSFLKSEGIHHIEHLEVRFDDRQTIYTTTIHYKGNRNSTDWLIFGDEYSAILAAKKFIKDCGEDNRICAISIKSEVIREDGSFRRVNSLVCTEIYTEAKA